MTSRTDNGDNSVVLSLTELVRLEESRVREEEAERARIKASEERFAMAAAHSAREREAAAIARDNETRAELELQAARDRARAEARELAAVEVAKIEARGRMRIEEESAARAHELALLRTRSESSGRRREIALAAVLGLVVLASAVLGLTSQRRSSHLAQENLQLRRGQIALAEERDHARANELVALDRRHGALRARALSAETASARATPGAARQAIDERALDHDRVRAFRDALDALQARVEIAEKVAVVDGRAADLAAWAADRQRTLIATARAAAKRAHAENAGEAELGAYVRALDALREALEPSARGGAGHAPKASEAPTRPTCSNAADPLCGLNGKAL